MEHVRLGPDLDSSTAPELARLIIDIATVNGDGPCGIYISGRPPEEDVDLSGLKAFIVPFAGVPERVRDFGRRHPDIAIYNLHFNALITAEMAVGLLIAAARNIASADRMLRQGVWRGRQTEDRNITLSGKHAVIYGFGSIGRQAAEILEALGMTVEGIRREHEHADLIAALGRAHALVITAPSTDETRGSIGRTEILALRHPRLIVNVGRGDIVDEAALYDLCRSGDVAAGGIDVWYQYPDETVPGPHWPSRFPFQDLGNVVMSPHRGGNGDDTEARRVAALAGLIRSIISGHDVRPVDVKLGY